MEICYASINMVLTDVVIYLVHYLYAKEFDFETLNWNNFDFIIKTI